MIATGRTSVVVILHLASARLAGRIVGAAPNDTNEHLLAWRGLYHRSFTPQGLVRANLTMRASRVAMPKKRATIVLQPEPLPNRRTLAPRRRP